MFMRSTITVSFTDEDGNPISYTNEDGEYIEDTVLSATMKTCLRPTILDNERWDLNDFVKGAIKDLGIHYDHQLVQFKDVSKGDLYMLDKLISFLLKEEHERTSSVEIYIPMRVTKHWDTDIPVKIDLNKLKNEIESGAVEMSSAIYRSMAEPWEDVLGRADDFIDRDMPSDEEVEIDGGIIYLEVSESSDPARVEKFNDWQKGKLELLQKLRVKSIENGGK